MMFFVCDVNLKNGGGQIGCNQNVPLCYGRKCWDIPRLQFEKSWDIPKIGEPKKMGYPKF